MVLLELVTNSSPIIMGVIFNMAYSKDPRQVLVEILTRVQWNLCKQVHSNEFRGQQQLFIQQVCNMDPI